MKMIALEESFWYDKLATEGSNTAGAWLQLKSAVAADWQRKLVDFTEYRLPDMDRNGVDMQVLSLNSPGIQVQPDPDIAVADARTANDFLADIIKDHPQRFAGLAAVPMQDPSMAAAELRRAIELGLHGALVNDHTLGHYLDERQYAPFDRYPAARVILGHMGEFLPFQLSRLDSRFEVLDFGHPLDKLPSQYFGTNIAITTTGMFSHAALIAAIQEIGVDNVMFSIDYPFESTEQAVQFLRTAPLAPADQARVAHVNAERILRLNQ